MTAEQSNDLNLGQLSEREAEILRRSGERVFELSRRLADAERSLAEARQRTAQLEELLNETRRSRDTLLAHTESLQRLLEREYDERAELRRLLAGLQMQMQSMLNGHVAAPPPGLMLARAAGQKAVSSRPAPPPPPAEERNGWLRSRARELRSLGRQAPTSR
jgi:hypothetical protein